MMPWWVRWCEVDFVFWRGEKSWLCFNRISTNPQAPVLAMFQWRTHLRFENKQTYIKIIIISHFNKIFPETYFSCTVSGKFLLKALIKLNFEHTAFHNEHFLQIFIIDFHRESFESRNEDCNLLKYSRFFQLAATSQRMSVHKASHP